MSDKRQPCTEDLPHPQQPIGWDRRGVIRFKKNAIVDHLLFECSSMGGTDLNRIAVMVAEGQFTNEDQIQLAQLIGYSVSGFGDLSYVPNRLVRNADRKAARIASGVK